MKWISSKVDYYNTSTSIIIYRYGNTKMVTNPEHMYDEAPFADTERYNKIGV